MATDRSLPSPDLAMSSSTNDSPYTTKLQTALRNANPALADTLLHALNPPRKQSHTPDQGGGLDGASASVSASVLPSSSTTAVSPSADAVLPQPPHVPPPTPDLAAAQRKQETNDGAIDTAPGYPQQERFTNDAYHPFSDHPRESSIVSAYSGLADAAFSRLPERDQFLTALSAKNCRYANATDPDTAFATDIRNFVEHYPSPLGDTVRFQRAVLALSPSRRRVSG